MADDVTPSIISTPQAHVPDLEDLLSKKRKRGKGG